MREISVRTERRTQLLEITREVEEAVDGTDAAAALVFVPHTTAGLTINEHADPAVARDFERALERMVGEGWGWEHIEAGEENAPSHIRAALMGPQVVVPVEGGRLALGTWQGIFFCELDGPRDRKVLVYIALVIEVENLSKRFGKTQAVAGLSFRVEPGAITGFLGPNGAGKSTTLPLGPRSRAPRRRARRSSSACRTGSCRRPLHQVGAVLEASEVHPGRSGRNHLRVLAAAAGFRARASRRCSRSSS